MVKSDKEEIQNELQSLRLRVKQLEQELQRNGGKATASDWRTRKDYWTYYATAGFFFGNTGGQRKPAG